MLAESQALLREGLVSLASKLLEEMLEIYPHSIKGLRVLAQIRMLQKRPHDAVPLLKQALGIMASPASAAVQIFNKSFGNEDAEYLEQKHIRQTDRREYDPFAEAAIQHKETASHSLPPAIAGFSARKDIHLNGREPEVSFAEQTDELPQVELNSTDTTNSTSDTQNPITALEEQVYPANESEVYNHSESEESVKLHDELNITIDDLLADEDNFVEQAISQEITFVHDDVNLALEEGSTADVIPDETEEDDEWETIDVINEFDDESFWEEPTDQAAIDSLPTQRDFSEIPDRLTRAERALQVAMKVGEEFDWDRKGIKLLAIIFDRYWWSASQAAIRREIAAGMTPQELMLAEDVRQIWYQHPEFWSASGAFGEIVQRYTLISWPTALSLIRSFKGYPQSEEIESLLNSCFERWQESAGLQRRFQGFYTYALYRVGAYGDLHGYDGWVIFDQYSTDESDFDNVAHVARSLARYGIHIDHQAKCIEPRPLKGRLFPNKQKCTPLPEGISPLPEVWDENFEDSEEESC